MDNEKEYIDELKQYITKAEERLLYSLKRFDILIISLSSGGLILALNIFKSFDENTIANKINLVQLAWIAFSISLISNIISQITGYFANKYDIKYTNNIIKEIKGKKLIGNQKRIELFQRINDYFTAGLNIISFLALISGISLLTFFQN